jgi:hypothetical protein
MLTAPTPQEFTTRYPAFISLDAGLVGAVLTESLAYVDETWIAADQNVAIMAYAAHCLAVEGYGSNLNIDGQSVATAGPVARVKVGDVQTDFTDKSRAQFNLTGADSALAETPYGRKFIELRRRSFPGAITV